MTLFKTRLIANNSWQEWGSYLRFSYILGAIKAIERSEREKTVPQLPSSSLGHFTLSCLQSYSSKKGLLAVYPSLYPLFFTMLSSSYPYYDFYFIYL